MLAFTVKAAVAGIAVLASLATATPIAEPASINPMLESRTEVQLEGRSMLTPHTTIYQGPTTNHWRKLRLLILEQHNIHRQKHGVHNLTWSDMLADQSQQFTNMCAPGEGWASLSPGHGSNTMNTGSVSEDTYEQATIDAVSAWAGEANDGGLTYDPVECSGVCGHFTQMVWKQTTRVGCSWNTKKCDNLVTFQCYYDPPGNIANTMTENVLPSLPSYN